MWVSVFLFLIVFNCVSSHISYFYQWIDNNIYYLLRLVIGFVSNITFECTISPACILYYLFVPYHLISFYFPLSLVCFFFLFSPSSLPAYFIYILVFHLLLWVYFIMLHWVIQFLQFVSFLFGFGFFPSSFGLVNHFLIWFRLFPSSFCLVNHLG